MCIPFGWFFLVPLVIMLACVVFFPLMRRHLGKRGLMSCCSMLPMHDVGRRPQEQSMSGSSRMVRARPILSCMHGRDRTPAKALSNCCGNETNVCGGSTCRLPAVMWQLVRL